MSDQEQRTPEEIRRDIDQTREELGDTAEAVAAKADVKEQARSKVDETKGKLKAKVEGAKAKAQEGVPESASAGAGQAQQFAQENPLPLAIGGAFIAGFVLGKLLSR